MRISIIIPTLNEALALPLLLRDLAGLGTSAEIIVCDGGSTDATCEIAVANGARFLQVSRGRAAQMRAGAQEARTDLFVFLHADTRVPPEALAAIAALAPGDIWGFWRPRLRGRSRWLPVVAFFMHWRSRLSHIATGDQGLFVGRSLYEAVEGFPEQPLMEDIAICTLLRAREAPLALPQILESSGRRWDSAGALRTIALMWRLRLRYRMGADPHILHGDYYGH